ncbi:MAG TPA: efflux RND transporter periplasmic adaptor subunit [Candidatus Kapabacteria bacterium]|nr:efflux RND transporter periplasmic adaptor subunit [Candidatus Kapabacteria bacterium]
MTIDNLKYEIETILPATRPARPNLRWPAWSMLPMPLLCAALLCACGGNGSPHDPAAANAREAPAGAESAQSRETEHAEEIRMTPAMMKEAGITVEPLARQPVRAVVRAPGRVVPTQNGIAHVGTVVPGRVARLLVSEGSHVARGEGLAEIEAFDIGELKGELMRARAGAEQARLALARQEKLGAEGIGAGRTLEEARTASLETAAALHAVEAKLRAAGINPASVEEMGFSSRIILRSPITGIVARRRVALGEYLEPSRDAFEVVNIGTVWIDAQLPPEVAATLHVGAAGFVRDREDRRLAGRIAFISPTVDPGTRTVTVRTEVANPEMHLRPELFVTVEFERPVSGYALAAPRDAIEREGSGWYVYREQEPNTFRRVPVQIGDAAGERTIVTAGLAEGDRIAVSGLFYLKSARQKGELEEHDD